MKRPYDPELVERIDDRLREIMENARSKALKAIVDALGMTPPTNPPLSPLVCRNCGMRSVYKDGLCIDCYPAGGK